MEPCKQPEGISTTSSSKDDSPEPGSQCCEEVWMPIMQSTVSHYARNTDRLDNPDTIQYVHTNALEELSSNFETATTSIGLHGTIECSSATSPNGLLPGESEDFDTWLNTFCASPNIEDGLIVPESSETALFPVGDSEPTFSGSSTWEKDYYTDAAIHNSLPSSYLDFTNDTSDVMRVNSPIPPKPFPTNPGSDDSEKSNGSEMRYQLVRKLAPAAEAQFMTRQERNTNNEQLMVPATKPRKIRQRFDPLKRKKTKEVRRLGACLRCRTYKEPVSSMPDLLSLAN